MAFFHPWMLFNLPDFSVSPDSPWANDSIPGEDAKVEENPNTPQQISEQIWKAPHNVREDYLLSCFGAVHTPLFNKGEPFEKLAPKMEPVENADYKIRKRILREGYGPILPSFSTVMIMKCDYLNNARKPYIKTYFSVDLSKAVKASALTIALKTMKLRERSQFLVHPDFIAPSDMVPPNSTLLYDIEVMQLTEIDPSCIKAKGTDFGVIYKSALALCCEGNDLYCKSLIREATKMYNTAESMLDECLMIQLSEEDCNNQQKLLLRLRSNLVVCYTIMQEPHLTCLIYNRMHYMEQRSKLKIPVKVFFNHARSLSSLCHYKCAEEQLRRAQHLAPRNLAVAKELITLDAKAKESYNQAMALAKTTFENMEILRELDDKDEITHGFKECLTEHCTTLSKDDGSKLYYLPDKLTEMELAFAKEQACKNGLELKCVYNCGINMNIIIKSSKLAHD